MADHQFTSIAELDAAHETAATVGYALDLRTYGPTVYQEAMQEVQARQYVCGISRLEALRLVRDAYKAGAR